MPGSLTPDQLAGIRALAESLPPGTALPLPRELVLDLLDDNYLPSGRPAVSPPDLTVAEVAERFHRKPSTVRGWILAGRLRSYLFNGREHRVTLSAALEFEETQRQVEKPRHQRRGKVTQLDTWRTAS